MYTYFIFIYAAEEKTFLTGCFYRNEAGYGAVSGKRAGFPGRSFEIQTVNPGPSYQKYNMVLLFK